MLFRSNYDAIDSAEKYLKKIAVPKTWATATTGAEMVKGADNAALSQVLKGAIVEITEEQVGQYGSEALKPAKQADSVLACGHTGKLTAPKTASDNGAKYFAVVVYLPADTGMEVAELLFDREGGVTLETDLGVSFVATQASGESDSFGDDYDAEDRKSVV